MRYLTVAAEYTGSCVRDDFQGQVECHELLSDKELCRELEKWNDDYKMIIPLDINERKKRRNEIDMLDKKGMVLAGNIANAIQGGAKVRYYSEGLLKYLDP